MEGVKNPSQRAIGKIEIFEEEENSQRKRNRNGKPDAPLLGIFAFIDPQPAVVVDLGLRDDERHILPPPEHVEDVAGREQQPDAISRRRRKIRQHHKRQEYEVFEGIKQHQQKQKSESALTFLFPVIREDGSPKPSD
jgi:hypothetical protein